MKALLLLAGQSKRFWPLTEKTLFPICGTTLLQIQIERLRGAGITDITLIGGSHNLPQAGALFPELRTIEQEDLSLGMRGALLSALPQLKTGPVMIVGGNDVIDAGGFQLLMKQAAIKGTDGVILAARVTRYFPGGYLTLKDNRVLSIVEKPEEGKEPSDLVTIVAHVHNNPADLLASLKAGKASAEDGYEQALDRLFREKKYLAAPYEGPWLPVKYPWHLLPLLQHLLTQMQRSIHPSVEIHPSAVIEGNVTIGEGSRVMAHATVVGPCVISKRCVIANNALVRQASIGDDCVVGFGSEVKSSVLAGKVWTHMTYIGDSIIGRNVSFGGGSLTGNLRLDEGIVRSVVQGREMETGLTKFGTAIGDGCRLGIHTSINPGMKIGAGSFIGSASLISEDIPDRSFMMMKEGKMDIRPNRSPPPDVSSRTTFRSQPQA
ncbi:MAG: NTP transferase domain-containing protein [Candidatus Peribacteraceae bacterium]|nr:NTP transferase domain-containing protein [Candidatus Peribacteraceae bacterium]